MTTDNEKCKKLIDCLNDCFIAKNEVQNGYLVFYLLHDTPVWQDTLEKSTVSLTEGYFLIKKDEYENMKNNLDKEISLNDFKKIYLYAYYNDKENIVKIHNKPVSFYDLCVSVICNRCYFDSQFLLSLQD